jgi:hypothetical protein
MSSDSKEPSGPSSWDKLRAAIAKNPEFAAAESRVLREGSK